MKDYLIMLPIRLAIIPVIWMGLTVCVLALIFMVVVTPVVCLICDIKFGDK